MKYIEIGLIVFGLLRGQVAITEVMYNLSGSDSPNEFVELFNLSFTDSIDLHGFTIRDRASADALVDSGYGLMMAPRHYALILEGDYSFSAGLYSELIPDSTLLLKVDDSSIGNGLSGVDSLYLADSTGSTVDSVGWTDRADPGFSLEKIRYLLDNSMENWSPSRDSLGTPGRRNSVYPLEIDGNVLSESPLFRMDTLNPGEAVTEPVILTNSGFQPISGFIQVYVDSLETEVLPVGILEALDTLAVPVTLGQSTGGYHTVEINWTVDGDLDTDNNRGRGIKGVRFQPGDILLNEFLAAPTGDQTEFVECISQTPLRLYRWAFTDNRPTHFSRVIQEVTVPSRHYIVLAADSSRISAVPDSAVFLTPVSWSSLNNSGDAIRLLDPFGTLIDSLVYTSDWGLASGISLEKRLPELSSPDSSNWRQCRDSTGWTPGRINSVHPLLIDGALQSVALNYNNSIPDSATEISALVRLSNPGLTSIRGNIEISEDAAVLATRSVSSLAPGDSVTLEIPLGTFSSGSHRLVANWLITGDGDSLNNHDSVLLKIRYPQGVIQFNEFFPLPNNDQTEFVELVSLRTLPLTGWSLMDSRKIPVILSEKMLRPFDLVTIAGDSAILIRLPEPEYGIILAGTFPTLNNSGDALYLLDVTGSVIDSLHYTPDWPLAEEHSLEKISPSFPSSELSSWKSCVAPEGETPGRPNSVLLAARDGELLPKLAWSPRFPEPEETVRCSVRVTNQGLEPITGSISVELGDEELAEIPVPLLARLDTVQAFPVFSLPGEGPQPITVSFHISGDGNPWNNMTTDTIWVRYSPGCVVLNEFLAIPDSGVAEFVEVILQRDIVPGPWRISDGSSEAILPQFGGSGAAYIVLGADSSWAGLNVARTVIPGNWPALNNSGDRILLMDPTGKRIDSLKFTTDWALTPGRSLEKFRPTYPSGDFRSWGVSVAEDGMTPGKPNSILVDTLTAKAVIRYEPDPFSPDGDGRDDRLWIHYRLPYNQAVFTVEVFDAAGRQIATPVSRQVVSREGVLSWDGHRGNGEKARIGLYLVKAEAEDVQSSKRWENLQTVVLAGRLSK